MLLPAGARQASRRRVRRAFADGSGNNVLIVVPRWNVVVPAGAAMAPAVLPQVWKAPMECACARRSVRIEEVIRQSGFMARDEPGSWIRAAAPSAGHGETHRVPAAEGCARRGCADSDVVGLATTPNCPQTGAARFDFTAPDGCSTRPDRR